MINHYNADGTTTQGILTLNAVTVSPGLKNGFPAEMYTWADRDYYKGGHKAFQDAIRSQQPAFDAIDSYLRPPVEISIVGFDGIATSGPVQGMVQGLAAKSFLKYKH